MPRTVPSRKWLVLIRIVAAVKQQLWLANLFGSGVLSDRAGQTGSDMFS